MMLNRFDASLQERLKVAEQAETEVSRLQPMASEAPQLRAEIAKTQRAAERQQARETAMNQAKQAVEAATEKQTNVPEILGQAARAVNDLYATLRSIEASRQEAMEALAIADRVDYDIELEDGEAHEASLDRDTRGLAYALAGRHGDVRVKKLLEELTPGFGMLEGCNLDEPLYRDVANFVMERVKPATPTVSSKKKKSPVDDPFEQSTAAV